MCNVSGILFGCKNIKSHEVAHKRVLDVGSYDVNGSLCYFLEQHEASEWVGVDIQPCDHSWHSPCVTDVCDAGNLLERFGVAAFDLVITTEMMEHVKDWRGVIHNLKGVLKPGCPLILTTRSPGYPRHGHPNDHWRYTEQDMRVIFADFTIETLESDRYVSGVFIRAVKPKDFAEVDLSTHKLTPAPPPKKKPRRKKR